MRLDQDSLDYGYILKTLQDDSWWHMHIARSAIEYHCELLGKKTSLLLNIQSFLPGVWANSPEFILTLDGEGVDYQAKHFCLIPNGDYILKITGLEIKLAQFNVKCCRLCKAVPSYRKQYGK